MEIILLKDVEKVGKSSQVIKVNDGFARNFLIPKGLAIASTQKNLQRIEQEKKLEGQRQEKQKKLAQELADKIRGLSCTVSVETNENDTPYGSVTQVDIVKAMEVEGYQIDKNDVLLEKPIVELGIFDVEVKLHPEVVTKIKLWVTKR